MQKSTIQKLALFESGLIVGAALAIGAMTLINKKKTLNSKKILKKVRKHFDKGGKIEVSWIEEEHIDLLQMDEEIPVFIGGIVRNEDGFIKTYEFTADAKTGTLITIKEMEEEE
ncbi:MAG: peptidase [Streptococcaceae bacterium]|jgi:predicted small secreted protein|nr:peptidase [Streptococcaceae bacterium]